MRQQLLLWAALAVTGLGLWFHVVPVAILCGASVVVKLLERDARLRRATQ